MVPLASGDRPTAVAAPGDECNSIIQSATALVSAASGSANDGKVICVRAGNYGGITLSGRHAAKVTLKSYPGETAVLGQVDLKGVSNLRLEGFDMKGVDTNSSSASGIEIVNNSIHDCVCFGLRLWGGDSNILFEGNVVKNIAHNGEWWSGWGINATGGNGGIRGLRIRYNTFDSTAQDAAEIGETYDSELVGNVFRNIKPPPGSDAHTDSFMLWANSRNWLVKDNRFEDGRGLLISGTSDVRFENNLVVRMENWCWQNGPSGSSPKASVRTTWVRNTVYDCGSDWNGGGFGGGYGFNANGDVSGSEGNRLERNVLTSFSSSAAAQFAYQDYNVIVQGPRRGAHDIGTVPQFRDRIDYLPTNLPFEAGYRKAPAGAGASAVPSPTRALTPPAPVVVPRRACAGLKRKRLRKCRMRRAVKANCGRFGRRGRRAVCVKRTRALIKCTRINGPGKRAKRRRAACRREAHRLGRRAPARSRQHGARRKR